MGNRGFFISHSSSQDEVADKFATTIKDVFSLPTIVDHQDFIGGDNWVMRMFDAITQTDFTICLITQEFLLSTPCMDELSEAYRQNKLLMVLLEDVDVPLRVRVYLDLRGDKGTQKLERYLRQVLSGDLIPEERVLRPKVAKAAEGEVLVLLCRFTLKGNRVDPAGVWADKLSNEVAHKLREYKIKFSFLDLQIESEEEAKALNKEYGSVLVVWGTIGDDYVIVNYTPVDTQFEFSSYRRATDFRADINHNRGVVKTQLFYRYINNAADTEYVTLSLTAWVLMKGKQYYDAIHLFTRALDLVPSRKDFDKVRNSLFFHRAQCLYLIEDNVSAWHDFAHFVQLVPENAWGYYYKSRILLRMGNVSGALQELDRSISVSDRHPTFLALKGLFLLKSGKSEDAFKLLSEAINSDPSEPSFHVLRGQSALVIGDFNQAIIDFNKSIELGADSIWILLYRGYAYLHKGDFNKARSDLTNVLRKDPKLALAYPLRAATWVKLGDLRKALQDYDAAIQAEPTFAELYFDRANVHVEMSQFKSAVDDFSQCISLNPEMAVAYDHRGNCYLLAHRYQAALSDYDQAVELEPTNSGFWCNRGLGLLRLKKYDEALIAFNQATYFDDSDAEPYVNRAEVYIRQRNYLAANDEIEDALRRDPHDVDFYIVSAFICIHLDDFAKSISSADQALALDQRDTRALRMKACAYVFMHQYDEAVRAASKAISLGDKSAECYYYRGVAYKFLLEFEKAARDFAAAVKADPENDVYPSQKNKVMFQKGGGLVVSFEGTQILKPSWSKRSR